MAEHCGLWKNPEPLGWGDHVRWQHEQGFHPTVGDRWIEALLGARLRFHHASMTQAEGGRVYKRWSQLYHSDHPV